MLIQDPIGDFLSRIKNAVARNREAISLPTNKMINSIAEILKTEGFINDYKVVDAKPQPQIEVQLKYVGGESAVRSAKRVSKPGRRIYHSYNDMPKRIKGGLGFSIYSTPVGIITNKEAINRKVGGECICTIY